MGLCRNFIAYLWHRSETCTCVYAAKVFNNPHMCIVNLWNTGRSIHVDQLTKSIDFLSIYIEIIMETKVKQSRFSKKKMVIRKKKKKPIFHICSNTYNCFERKIQQTQVSLILMESNDLKISSLIRNFHSCSRLNLSESVI